MRCCHAHNFFSMKVFFVLRLTLRLPHRFNDMPIQRGNHPYTLWSHCLQHVKTTHPSTSSALRRRGATQLGLINPH